MIIPFATDQAPIYVPSSASSGTGEIADRNLVAPDSDYLHSN